MPYRDALGHTISMSGLLRAQQGAPLKAYAMGFARRALVTTAAFAVIEGAWFACVLGAANGRPWAGTLVALAVTAGFVAFGGSPRIDAALVGFGVGIGLVWDTALAQLGWIFYAEPGPVPLLAPAWILALWALFAAVIREPMRWLHARLRWAALLGAIGGPLSYAAAARMGAIVFEQPTRALAALALGWAAIVPLLLVAARRWDSR